MSDDKSISSDFHPELLLAKPPETKVRASRPAKSPSSIQPHRTLKDLPVRDRLRVLNAAVAENKKKKEKRSKLHDALFDAMAMGSFFMILYLAIREYL